MHHPSLYSPESSYCMCTCTWLSPKLGWIFSAFYAYGPKKPLGSWIRPSPSIQQLVVIALGTELEAHRSKAPSPQIDTCSKVTDATVRDAATTINAATQDTHVASIAGKWKGNETTSIYLHLSKPTIKPSEQFKSVMKTAVTFKSSSTFCSKAFLAALLSNSLSLKKLKTNLSHQPVVINQLSISLC